MVSSMYFHRPSPSPGTFRYTRMYRYRSPSHSYKEGLKESSHSFVERVVCRKGNTDIGPSQDKISRIRI